MNGNNATRMGQPGVKQTVIEDDTEFRGKLNSKCPVVVRGAVDGEVAGPSLHVSSSGTVTGQVKVTDLRSEGTIGGELDADNIQLAGTVKNNTVIRAKSLEVKLSPANGRLQVTFGECELAVGEIPRKEDAVSAMSGKAPTAADDAAASPPIEAAEEGSKSGKGKRRESIPSPA